VATIPFSIYHFDRTNHYSVLGNLLAMPVMGFVAMPAAALSVLLMPFGLEYWPLRVLGWGIDAMLSVGRWVSGLPGAVSVVSAWPTSALALVSLGGLWVGLWRRRWRWLGVAPILLGFGLAYTNDPPDLLIGRDGLTIAMRSKDGTLKLLRPAKDKYSASEWLRRDGDDQTADAAVATKRDGVSCDSLGCIAKTSYGSRIAFVLKPEAFAEDCSAAVVVISAVPVRHACQGPEFVADIFDVARSNGYAIWLGPPIVSETVEHYRGARPWSAPTKPRRAQYRRISPTSLP
jgi:competence protein ComEC